MELSELKVLSEVKEVTGRLSQLDLEIDGLRQAVQQGLLAKRNVTSNYPKTAPGWYQYAETVAALRDLYLGDTWSKNSKNNIETIVNKKRGLKIAYASVDRACSEIHSPNPRSPRGDGTIEACAGNQVPQIKEQLGFEDSGFTIQQLGSDPTIYYLMVDPEGRAELSLVIVNDNGEYAIFLERIYIIDTEYLSNFDEILHDDSDEENGEEIEVNVVRK